MKVDMTGDGNLIFIAEFQPLENGNEGNPFCPGALRRALLTSFFLRRQSSWMASFTVSLVKLCGPFLPLNVKRKKIIDVAYP